MHVGVFISWRVGKLFTLPRALSDDNNFWGFLMQNFLVPFWWRGQPLWASLLCCVSVWDSSPHLGVLPSALSCGACIEIWYPLGHQVFSFCVLALWFWRPSWILAPGEIPFLSLQLICTWHFLYTLLCIISVGGGSLESQVSRLLEETPCRFIDIIPSKMEVKWKQGVKWLFAMQK